VAPLWRQAFDALERPVAAVSESWVQSDVFMDLAAAMFRAQRRLGGELQRATEQWLHAWGMLSHADLAKLTNQIASVERQLRELRRELEQAPSETQAPAREAA